MANYTDTEKSIIISRIGAPAAARLGVFDGGSAEPYTIVQLQTTHLAKDNSGELVIVRDANPPYMAFPDVYSQATGWRKVDGTSVTVDPDDAVSVLVSPKPLRMSAGSTKQLTAVVSPPTAAQYVTWTSDNPLVTVSASGLVTLPTPLDVATKANITATTVNGKTDSTSLEVTTATGQLRYVSALNRLSNRPLTTSTSNEVTMCSVFDHRIGSGDVTGISLMAVNAYVWLGNLENTGNILTIEHTYVNLPGVAVKRATWSGQNGVVIPNGGFAKSVDIVTPAMFGLDKFVVGTLLEIRMQCKVPANGTFPTNEAWGGSKSGGHTFNAATVQCTNLDQNGNLLYTGAVTQAPQAFTCLVTGYFESGDPLVGLEFGDSIASGSGDSPTGMGAGYLEKARIGTDWTKAIAGLNISRPSGQAFTWSGKPTLLALIPQANYLVEEHGTNNLDNTANIDISGINFFVNNSKNVWQACKDNQAVGDGLRTFRVIRTKLFPRVLEADKTQVYGPKWAAGGNADQFNDLLANQPLVDVFFIHDELSRGSVTKGEAAYYLFKDPTFAPDGTHPAKVLVDPVAAKLRVATLALAA